MTTQMDGLSMVITKGRSESLCRNSATDISVSERLRQIVVGLVTKPLQGLDPPFVLYFPRVFVRTILRLIGLGTPCSPGCNESFREVFFLA